MAQPLNGRIIGPTLDVKPGDTIEVTFDNGPDQDANIHYCGLHVRPTGISDNVFRTFHLGQTVRSVVTLHGTTCRARAGTTCISAVSRSRT